MQRVKGGLAEGKLRTPQANYWGIRRKRSAEKTKDMDSWNPSVWSRLWNEMGVDRVWLCLQVVLGWGGGGGDGKELTKDSLRRGDVWSKGSKGKVQADLKSGFHDGTHFRSREGNRMEREPGGTEPVHSRQVGEVLGIPQILKGTLIDNS